MAADFLFVYGTLRQESQSEVDHLLAKHAEFMCYATFQGTLYRVGYYPGAVTSNTPSSIVYGEVYRLCAPQILLPQLDRYEECGPNFPDPTEYVRCKRRVFLKNGRCIRAWVYLYNRPTHGFESIASGTFAMEAAARE